MNLNELKIKFKEYFGENNEEIKTFFSPSRINIIGEHIDYNGGEVFPCAIEIGTYGIARKNDDNKLRLKSLNLDKSGEISLDNIEYKEENDWMNYPLGVAKYTEEKGYKIGGLDILVYGNIPNGSGLSSSASLEVLFGEIFSVFYNDGKIPHTELALIGMSTENKFIGVNSGIMDQFVIANGKKDHAVLINTNTMEYSYVPFDLGNHKIVILNTNKRRELKDSKYNERRAECEEALRIIREYKDIKYLCDLRKNDLDILSKIKDPVVRKRAEHVVLENERVKEAVQALKNNDIKLLGELLVQSDDSLRELYEVTGPHLDAITKYSNEFESCLGARMTGAGFGGCGIAIVESSSVEDFKNYVGPRYKEKTGLEAEFIISDVGNKVSEI